MATALDLYQPFDAGNGANVTEDNWRKQFRHYLETGVLSGEDNELQVYDDNSGMQVKVKTGKCILRGHYGENTSEKTLAIGANSSGSTRIDRVVLRVDFVNNRIELDVIQGTPGGSAPAVTQNSSKWEISLAQVSIPTGDSSISGQTTDERDALWLFGTRNTPHRSYTPTWYGNSGGTAFTVGNGAASGRWKRDGRTIKGRAKFLMGSTSVAPAGNLVVSLPVAASSAILINEVVRGRLQIADASAGPQYYFANPVIVLSGGTTIYFRTDASPAVVVSTTSPITLATGDVLIVEFEYEAET